MKDGPDIARIAALIGDPARANMLTALMAGRALTAAELAQEAGVTAPTASGHLAKLETGGLVQKRKQGRHRYFELASNEVALTLEALMGLAASGGLLRSQPGPKDPALREARVCYNHLAGRRGVQMYESLLDRGMITLAADPDVDPSLTARGRAFALELGLDLDALERKRAPLCKNCLDWSERRSHLAGSLGRAFLSFFEEQDWLRRETQGRALIFTQAGSDQFDALFPNVVPLIRAG